MKYKVLLIFVGLVLGFLMCEGALRLGNLLKSDWLFFANEGISEYRISDSKLGFRLESNAPGHDANGFRNRSVPNQVDIVTIGDSQTWGVNANRDEAWPQALANISGYTVYSMALGFYNTMDYWLLLDEALELSPRVIIIGLYLANDVWGDYNDLHPEKSNISIEASKIKSNQNSNPLEKNLIGRIGKQLTKRFYTLRFLWNTLYRATNIKYKVNNTWTMNNPEQGTRHGKYLLEPGYRLLALDTSNPCIEEGLDTTKQVLVAISNKLKDTNVKLFILLIPTQELVFADVVELTDTYAEMVSMENQMRNEIIVLCEEYNIDYIDPLPLLSEAVHDGEQLYPFDLDGHPLSTGYFIIASATSNALGKYHRPTRETQGEVLDERLGWHLLIRGRK